MRLKQILEDSAGTRPSQVKPAADTELDKQARAEAEAGLGVPIDEVETWVKSWDTANELPIPKARPLR